MSFASDFIAEPLLDFGTGFIGAMDHFGMSALFAPSDGTAL